MNEAPRERGWLDGLATQPGLLVTLGYLLVSLIGMIFSWALLRQFGFNVFSFADVTDFLVSALREPMTFVLAGTAMAFGLLMDRVAQRERRWLERRQPASRPGRAYLAFSRWTTGRRGFVPMLFFASYSAAFIWVYADHAADRIRAGEGERVVVTRAAGTVLEGVLIAATSRYLFVYGPASGQAEAIPHEAIGGVRPSPRAAEKSRPALAEAGPAALPAASAEAGKYP